MALVNTNTKQQIVQVIKKGTPFVLPKNATIIAATKTEGVSKFTTTCDGLTDTIEGLIETYTCYGTAIPIAAEDGGATSSMTSFIVEGFVINGTQYLFQNTVTLYYYTLDSLSESVAFKEQVNKNDTLSKIIIDICINRYNYNFERGSSIAINFKGIPSTMTDSYLIGKFNGGINNPQTAGTIYFLIKPIDELHPDAVIVCPCVSS